MPRRKGFTLMDILIVLIILGILAVIAVPNYNTYIQQAAAQAAQNNLITVYNAQKNYYLSPVGSGKYCRNTGPPPHLCGNVGSINTNLTLNITDNNFAYECDNDASGFVCTATNNSAATFKLNLTNNPIILPGGTGCTSYPWNAPCNPTCTYPAHPNYCPS